MLLLKILLNLNFDVPTPWGIYFQDSATPQCEGLIELHDHIIIVQKKRAKFRGPLKALVTKEIW
ncbi:hypothetical protein GGS23DRAFT_591659 [Durotheca rogersii]|uniref:uncharacterized protein n=1 Tax=Durotheca rogersii TaxID=419775 RepID=UPI002220D080|nr:uncharacterized protein GGS23DRAFT_591659 [Durotheca rogersii]KAI5849675.1 hypothetical protein GGS23DRAFT_591659 [Durotheca rogersii]